MATEKYPQLNHNVPMDPDDVAAARARLYTGKPMENYTPPPSHGKGSRREIRPGEFVDDRVIQIGGPSSPSKDSPPELKKKEGRAVPGSYDPLKVYDVKLGLAVLCDGRMLSPAKSYMMVGDVCTKITTDSPTAIIDAVELGDVPQDPDAPPS